MTGGVSSLCSTVRDLTTKYMSGSRRSFDAFLELMQLLLSITVAEPAQTLRPTHATDGTGKVMTIGGPGGPTSPIRLRDGRWLRFAMTLYLADHEAGRQRLKVRKSSYQYQGDQDGQQEIFRYDYLRQPGDDEPSCHLNIHASLDLPGVLPVTHPLKKVHFPTDRVSLEAVLRLLMRDFRVPSMRGAEVWGPVLACSETEFKRIAHRPDPPGHAAT